MEIRFYLEKVSLNLFFFLFSLFFCHFLWAQNGAWQTKTDMPTARASASAATVNGKIYVMGGIESGVGYGEPASAIVEIYDPAIDSWDTKKSPMQFARNSFTSSVVNDTIYVFGGQSNAGTINISSVEAYDPQSDTWISRATMPDVRAGLSSYALNGKIYIIGGWKFNGPNSFYHFREVWEYDPANDSWDTNNELMPSGREYLTVSAAYGKIYAFGGWDESVVFDTVEMYDPKNDSWLGKRALPEKRVYLKSATLNDLIYIFGGSTLHSVPPKTNTWEYDPVSDSYRDVSSMPTGLMHGAAAVSNDKIYTFGGFEVPINFPVTASASVFEYDPRNDLERFVDYINVDKSYTVPGADTVLISTKISEPNGVNLWSLFKTSQGVVDSVQLFDDGIHHDEIGGDSIFANLWPVPSEENSYHINLYIFRADSDTLAGYINDKAAFTTIGPVYPAETAFIDTAYDSIEENQFFFLRLQNNGATTPASNLSVKLSTGDHRVAEMVIGERKIPDIAAGEIYTSTLFDYFSFKYSEGYGPDSTIDDPVVFNVTVSSNDYPYWLSSFEFIASKGVTSIDKRIDLYPKKFALFQNYPNPFNPITMISYQLPMTSDVDLSIYNLLGQKVTTLVNKKQPKGSYKVQWDASGFASGIYLYRLETDGGFMQVRKLVVLK